MKLFLPLILISFPLSGLTAPSPSGTVPDPDEDPNSVPDEGWVDQTPPRDDNDSDSDSPYFDDDDLFNGRKVITLGDSYASGTGIHKRGSDYDQEHGGKTTYGGTSYELTYRPDEECWRDRTLTPGPRYAAAHDFQSVFLACKGAEVEHVTNQLELLNAMYPHYSRMNWKYSIFLLTLGGNNMRTTPTETVGKLRISKLIQKCMGTRNCHEERANQISNFDAIEHLATVFLETLAQAASGARIRIMGYPKLMQPDPGCGTSVSLSRNEASWIDDQCVTLNDRIECAVASVKAAYPSVDMEFVGVYNYLDYGACGTLSSRRHIHDLRLAGAKTSDASFHPSELGYDAYYDAFRASL